jgi:hypothetical protein
VLGILFRHTHPHQCTEETARRSADTGTGQSRSQRSTRDDGTDPGNSERSDPGEESNHATEHTATDRAGRRALGCLGAGPLDQILLLLAVLDRDADLILGEALLLETLNCSFGISLIVEESHHRGSGARLVVFDFAHREAP